MHTTTRSDSTRPDSGRARGGRSHLVPDPADVRAFDVHRSAQEGVAVVTVRGDVDLETTALLREVLAAAAVEAPLVVVDLTGVTFLDCHALGGLVAAVGCCTRRGVRLVTVGHPPAVARLVDLFGLGPVLGDAGTVGDVLRRDLPPGPCGR